MANAWHILFEPTLVSLTPTGGGNFSAVTSTPTARRAAPGGSFPVVTSVRLHIVDDAKGPPPVQPGAAPVAATLELIGRAAPAAGAVTPPAFISLGILKGKVDYDMTGARPLPRFAAASRKVGAGPLTELDLTPGTDPLVTITEWAMQIDQHPQTFTTPFGSFFVPLPWQFIENPGRLQLSARLTVGGAVANDETRNTPLDIPLVHKSVPEDANTQKQRLPFFGVRNLSTKTNDHDPNPKTAFRLPAGNNTLSIIVHNTLTSFCTANTQTNIQAVLSAVFTIMSDAGFNVVNTLVGPAADADCALHWKRVGGHFMGLKITDPNQNQPASQRLEQRFAAAITSNTPGSVNIPSGMEENLPFFDFYVFAENVPPPNPIELAHSEGLISATGSTGGIFIPQVRKAVVTPIVIATGASANTPLRNALAQIDPRDHANLLATTICHEIGHTFGLRHGVSFINAPPYVGGDPQFARATMGSAGIFLGTSTAPARHPLGFFGPVHVQEIARLFF